VGIVLITTTEVFIVIIVIYSTTTNNITTAFVCKPRQPRPSITSYFHTHAISLRIIDPTTSTPTRSAFIAASFCCSTQTIL
jgi:hypothetical protein